MLKAMTYGRKICDEAIRKQVRSDWERRSGGSLECLSGTMLTIKFSMFECCEGYRRGCKWKRFDGWNMLLSLLGIAWKCMSGLATKKTAFNRRRWHLNWRKWYIANEVKGQGNKWFEIVVPSVWSNIKESRTSHWKLKQSRSFRVLVNEIESFLLIDRILPINSKFHVNVVLYREFLRIFIKEIFL